MTHVRDLIVRADRVHTLAGGPPASALLVRAGRVVHVGTFEEARGLAAPNASTLDASGLTVTPGFHDAHVHLGYHGLERRQVALSDTASLAEAAERIRRAAARSASGWVQGSGFSVHRWNDKPHREVLDAAAPGRPVLLRSQDHHGGLASSEALRLAGVNDTTPDPPGGRFERDAAGRLTGYLLESAVAQVAAAVPALTASAMREVLHEAAAHFASMGITTVHHMAYEPSDHARAIAQAASDPAFGVRVWACLPQEHLEAAGEIGVATGVGGGRYQVGGAKFFVDGALGSMTAAMLEPYGSQGGVGDRMFEADALRERVSLAVSLGFTPVAHAIGDDAVRMLLNAYEATQDLWRAAGLTPRVEHAQHVHPSDVQRLGEMGLVASMQPMHLVFDVATVRDLLADRIERAYPFRSLQAAGATLAFGSDTPVAPPDVWGSILAAERHGAPGDASLNAGEGIDRTAAVMAYTRGAAQAIGWQHRSGRLDVGADADFVLWSHDPLDASVSETTVQATYLAGIQTFAA